VPAGEQFVDDGVYTTDAGSAAAPRARTRVVVTMTPPDAATSGPPEKEQPRYNGDGPSRRTRRAERTSRPATFDVALTIQKSRSVAP